MEKFSQLVVKATPVDGSIWHLWQPVPLAGDVTMPFLHAWPVITRPHVLIASK